MGAGSAAGRSGGGPATYLPKVDGNKSSQELTKVAGSDITSDLQVNRKMNVESLATAFSIAFRSLLLVSFQQPVLSDFSNGT